MQIRRFLPSYPALVLCLTAVVGCGSDTLAEDILDEDGKADAPASDDQLVSTNNNNLELLFGWDYLHDAAKTTRCVATQTDTARGRDVRVGEPQSTFDLQLVTDRQSLATELGVDLAMQASYVGAQANAKLSLLNKFSQGSTSISYLVRIRRQYTVRHRHALQLSKVGSEVLNQGLKKFFGVCGTHYARGMRYGAELYVLLTYTAANAQTASELKAELGVDPGKGIPGVDLKGSTASRWSQAAQRSGVSVSVSVAAQGFTMDSRKVDSNVATQVLGAGVTDKMFAALGQINIAMQDSVEADACRDAGTDECWPAAERKASGCGGDGEEACGYYYNGSRGAIANGVAAALYTVLPNWNSDLDQDFAVALRNVQDNEDYLRSLGELLKRMGDAYLDEIAPFRAASATNRAAFNIPVGKTTQIDDSEVIPNSLEQLVAIADRWEFQFLPAQVAANSPEIGVAYERVEKAFKDCYQGSAIDMLKDCGPGDVDDLLQSPLWQETEAILADYDATGRLLPATFAFSPVPQGSFNGAVARCAATNFGSKTTPVFGRLPTKQEALYLAPLIGFGALDFSQSDIKNAIWYQESPSDGCGEDEVRIFGRNPAASGAGYACVPTGGLNTTEVLVLCVPPHGPLAPPSSS